MRLKSVEGISARDMFLVPPALIQIQEGYNVAGRTIDPKNDDDSWLIESIRANGVRDPLVIRVENETIFLVQGHRRLAAVRHLIAEGHDVATVPAINEARGTTEEDRLADIVISNSGKPLTPMQIGEICMRYRESGWTDQQIGEKLHYTPRYIQQAISIATAPASIRNMIAAGQVSGTLAYETIQRNGSAKDAAAELRAALEAARAEGRERVTAKTVKMAQENALARVAAASPEVTSEPEDTHDSYYVRGREVLIRADEEVCICVSARVARQVCKALNLMLAPREVA